MTCRPTKLTSSGRRLSFLLLAVITCVSFARAQHPAHAVSGAAVYATTKQLLAVAPKRFNGSAGHAAAEKFITDHFAPELKAGRLDLDRFTASTPAGLQTMTNIIVKFPSTNPSKRDGIIVLDSHYETNYPLKDIAFVGANDGACTTALLIQIGQYLRAHPPTGYSIYILFDDGEEAVKTWQGTDNDYGTRHLAAKWSQDGTLGHIKAFLLADMIGDRDLDIVPDQGSTASLVELLRQAARNTGHTKNVLQAERPDVQDGHIPFLQRGVPTLDLLDIDYGPHTPSQPDGWHHTADDTIDKISPQSLQISADVIFELINLINQH